MLGYNLLVFFVLANVLYWAIPTIGTALRVGSSFHGLVATMPSGLSRAGAWEFLWSGLNMPRAPFSYRSHVGWRHIPRSAPGTNVEGAYAQRRTINGDGDESRQAYFFGGSTMWGSGVDDAGTIPLHFAALTGYRSENFGELGYTAHQSLSLLTELLQAGRRPHLVMVYDGVNDALHKCRTELTATAHERERSFDQC